MYNFSLIKEMVILAMVKGVKFIVTIYTIKLLGKRELSTFTKINKVPWDNFAS